MSTKPLRASTQKMQSQFRPVKFAGKKFAPSLVRPRASAEKTPTHPVEEAKVIEVKPAPAPIKQDLPLQAVEGKPIARKGRVTVMKKSPASSINDLPPQAPETTKSGKQVKPRAEKQVAPNVLVAAVCPKLSRTCDVWNLTKCVYNCVDGETQCTPNAEVCLFAGDGLVANYGVTPTIVAPGFYQLSGAIAITNNEGDVITVTPGAFSLRVLDVLTPISVNISEDLLIAPTNTVYVSFSAAVPANVVVCDSELVQEFAVQVEYTVGDAIVITESEFVSFDCENIACECATTEFTLTDRVDDAVETLSDSITSENSGTEFIVERTIVIPSADTDNLVECPDAPTTEINVADLTPNDPVPGVCGPVACPASATATITANCVLAAVTATATSRVVYANNWCVQKTGEILPPCKCGDRRDDEICCSKCYAKWQITLTNNGSIVSQEQTVQVCINIGENCPLSYAKVFRVDLVADGLDESLNVTLGVGQSEVCADIVINPALPTGTVINVSVYAQQGTLTLDTMEAGGCGFAPSDVFLPILLGEEVTIETECVAGTESTLSDLIEFDGCEPRKGCVVTLPDCNECGDCGRQIAEATSIVLSSEDDDIEDVTVTLCDDDNGDAVRGILETLVQDSEDINLDAVVAELFPELEPCAVPTVPYTIVLTFYTKVPKDKCGDCTIINTARVETTPTADNPNGENITSEDSATVEADDCKKRKHHGCGCKHPRHPHGCGCGHKKPPRHTGCPCKHPQHPLGCGCDKGKKPSASSCSSGTCPHRKH